MNGKFLWATKGTTREAPRWSHHILAGFASQAGLEVATLFGDIERFYKFVFHAVLASEMTCSAPSVVSTLARGWRSMGRHAATSSHVVEWDSEVAALAGCLVPGGQGANSV